VTSKRRTLFSVEEVTPAEGEKYFEVSWLPDLHPALNELSPNGEITDKIIDIADDLIHAFEEDD
jgi:hypothetical protein